MSLLDDVSIVVTPNGYKAGTLFGAIPVPSEGAELVTNGDFSADASWTKQTGWTISGGSANCDGTQTGNSGIIQQNGIAGVSLDLQVGKQYEMVIDITVSTGLITYIEVGSNNYNDDITTTGIKTLYFSPTSTNDRISIVAGSTFVGSVNNVSVKEYTSADMDVTRATAATRVDENGLVNYAEVIGSEEVTNGDFATDSDWSKGTGWSISGGTAILDGTQTGGSSLSSSNMTVTVGKIYKVTVNVSATSSGFRLYDALGVVSYGLSLGENIFYRTPSSSTYTLTPLGLGGATGTISNVSVKEAARDNVPRIDYTGGGCPHILAEPQRTNLLPYSSDFSQWITSSVTLTPNATTSPSGSVDATLVDLSSTTDSRLVNNVGVVASTEYTLSFYLKKHESDSDGTFPLAYYDGSNYIKTYVNLTDVWQRFDLTFTNPSNSPFGYGLSRKGTTSDETLTRCYAWAGQLEQASYPTSYIPTSGSTVTRNQDIFTRDGIGSLINSTEGVLFVEMAALSDDGVAKYLTMNDGSSNNDVRIYFNTASNGISALLKSGTGATQAFLSYTVTDTTEFHKIAFVYAVNRFELWVDGEKRAEDLSGVAPVGLNTLEFSRASNFLPLFAKVKQLQVYNTALTDTQLAALTS